MGLEKRPIQVSPFQKSLKSLTEENEKSQGFNFNSSLNLYAKVI